MLFLGGNAFVIAESSEKPTLDTILGAQVLRASKHDTTLSIDEKLNTYRCETIEKYLGFEKSVIGKALEYSCSAPVVGVAFYVGEDLGHHSPEKVANYIKAEFAKNGMQAKVFIKTNHAFGSNVSYLIRGGRRTLNPIDPLNAIKRIEGFAADIKLVFFADNIISPEELGKWVKSEVAYIPQTS